MWRRDSNYWRLRIRTHEFVERQLVSLLDIDSVGKATIRALWKLGVNTAALLRDADPAELAQQLRAYNVPQCRPEKAPDVIREWQAQIRRLWEERLAARSKQQDLDDCSSGSFRNDPGETR